MTDPRILTPSRVVEDAADEAGLRPRRLDDYIGQDRVRENLEVYARLYALPAPVRAVDALLDVILLSPYEDLRAAARGRDEAKAASVVARSTSTVSGTASDSDKVSGGIRARKLNPVSLSATIKNAGAVWAKVVCTE